jgi:hypothetical protein
MSSDSGELMEKLRPRLTYANVIATLALFLALGGGAYAAIQLPKNSVGSKQLRKNSVIAAKIKNGAVTGAKINLASLGTVPSAVRSEIAANADHAAVAASAGSAASATDAKALGGKPASAFAASTVVRSATVQADGKVVAALSDGVTQSNIGPHTPASGFYCLDGLNPAPTAAVATVGFGAFPESSVFTEITPPGEPGCNAYVAIYGPGGLPIDAPFTILLH